MVHAILTMGGSLAVIPPNLLMKSFQKSLNEPGGGGEGNAPDIKGICINCNRCFTFQGKGVELELRKN